MLAVPQRFATHDDYLAWAGTRPDEGRYEVVEGYPVMSLGLASRTSSRKPTCSGSFRPPLLAVEILSPSSVERDLFTKRREYARAGLKRYWVVDPEAPRVIAYRGDSADMLVSADAAGDDRFRVDEPFPVELTPADLLR